MYSSKTLNVDANAFNTGVIVAPAVKECGAIMIYTTIPYLLLQIYSVLYMYETDGRL